MPVNIQFDLDIVGADIAPLATALGCAPNEIEAELRKHAKAALHEYVEAYLGRRAFSRGSDILEHRLALLIEHAFAGALPLEVDVSRLFQTPLTASRSLLRNTLSKYRYQLRGATIASAKAVLEAAAWDGANSHFRLTVRSVNLLNALNQTLIDTDAAKRPVIRLADSVATYAVSAPSYETLCNAFGAAPAAGAP